MIRVTHHRGQKYHTHVVDIFTGGLYCAWFYPSYTHPGRVTFSTCSEGAAPGEPPSDTLRALIEADAPWYVILDKLIEEYPQWESHFVEVAARQREEQEGADRSVTAAYPPHSSQTPL